MAKYRIVAARPKKAVNHLNSEFKLWKLDEDVNKWKLDGWKTINHVSDLISAGNEVKTGKLSDGKIHHGASVELELRIAKNDTNYKISEMPDE